MGENAATRNHHLQVFDVSIDMLPQSGGPICFDSFDDDGRPRRSGNLFTLPPSPPLCSCPRRRRFCPWRRYKDLRLMHDADLLVSRDCLDSECPHNNCSDRVGGALSGLGHSSAWVDRRTSCDAPVLLCELLHCLPPIGLLPCWRSHLRKEELHLHGCCPFDSW